MCIISVRILIIVTVSIQFGIIYFRFRSVFVLKIFSVIVILIVNGMDYFQFDLSFPLTNITLTGTQSHRDRNKEKETYMDGRQGGREAGGERIEKPRQRL